MIFFCVRWLVVHQCCRVSWMEVVMAYLRYYPSICLLCQSQYLRQRKKTGRCMSGHSTKHVQIGHALVCSFDPSDLELMPVNISRLGLHRWRILTLTISSSSQVLKENCIKTYSQFLHCNPRSSPLNPQCAFGMFLTFCG